MSAAPESPPIQDFSFSELNLRQQEVRDIVKRARPNSVSVIGFGGAVGGGKTYLDAWMAIHLSISFPGNRGVVGRDEFNKLETTTMQEFDKLCPPSLVTKRYNGSPAYRDIRLSHWPADVTSRVYFRGLSNWQSFGSEEYGFVILDEASEIPKMSAVMLLPRLRHRLPKVVTDAWAKRGMNENIRYVFLASSNPWPGWFAQWFADKKLDEILDALPNLDVKTHFVPSRIYDNPHLPPGYAEQQRGILLAAGMGEFADRMIEGRFDVYEGRIYERFDKLIHQWKYEEPTKDKYVRVVGGLDFGGENSLTSHYTAGLVGIVTATNRLIRVAEFKKRGPNITAQLLEWIVAQQARWGDPINKKIAWRADRSQSVGISIWKNMFNVTPSTGGMDSVDEGIKKVAARLERDETGLPGSFYLPTLTEWEEEMKLYRRDPESMKVVKENDDLVACDRYMAELLDKFGGDPNAILRNNLPVVR